MRSVSHSPTRIHHAVAEHLALSEADLLARVAEVERDLVIYRGLLQHALDTIHDLAGRERVRIRRVAALVAENRALRERRQAVA